VSVLRGDKERRIPLKMQVIGKNAPITGANNVSIRLLCLQGVGDFIS
jgi:pyrimidine operon attenuation protein/uracil phosphoribosyltransferase